MGIIFKIQRKKNLMSLKHMELSGKESKMDFL